MTFNRGLVFVVGAIAFFVGGRLVTRPKLEFFSASEFRQWWPFMSAELLIKLDEFRRRWGAPVIVSGAKGAIGRTGAEAGHSQHNLDMWGEVRAVDVFPQVPDGAGGYRYMRTVEDRLRANAIARAVGFMGVGIYTDTQPGNLLHLDVRKTEQGERVVSWSRVNGEYMAINEVLA